ncbi:MAG: hypothetical protein ACKO7B_10095 [Flavobacteriales bacterium]
MKRYLLVALISALVSSNYSCKKPPMARTANTRSLGKGDPTARPYSQEAPMATDPGEGGTAGSVMIAPVAEGTADTQTTATYRFIVSFFSTASGPDRESMTNFENWFSTYLNDKKLTADMDKISWGREGEMDLCFKLNGWSEQDQTAFVNAAKEQLKNAKQVNMFENEPCRHQKRP